MALCVAVASAGFITALNHTSVARVLFILALAPVLAAVLAWVTLGEPITRRTVGAMALALGGVTLMLGAPGEGSLVGDGLSFVVALAFAVTIVITRWRRDVSMAPATCLSQAILVVGLPSVRRSRRDRRRRPRLARRARHRPDRARLRPDHGRRAPDTRGAGGPHHAARGGARPAVGVAGARRAPEHADARRRSDRAGRDRDPDPRRATPCLSSYSAVTSRSRIRPGRRSTRDNALGGHDVHLDAAISGALERVQAVPVMRQLRTLEDVDVDQRSAGVEDQRRIPEVRSTQPSSTRVPRTLPLSQRPGSSLS